MPKFRKKPVVIEAVQFDKKDNANLLQFVSECTGEFASKYLVVEMGNLYVKTLEGKMLISHLDWLIRGVNGEFYPCKPDIFQKTYEPAD